MTSATYDLNTTYELEGESLVTPEQMRQQQEWEEDSVRRRRDLERQQLKSRDRRRQVTEKMSELRCRWEGLERRRLVRSRQGYPGIATPSIPTSTPTPGAVSLAGTTVYDRPIES